MTRKDVDNPVDNSLDPALSSRLYSEVQEENVIEENRSYPSAQERAQQGATWLDQDRPGWEELVDLGTLNLFLGTQCPLGQVYAGQVRPMGLYHGEGYLVGLTRLRSARSLIGDSDSTDTAYRYGFIGFTSQDRLRLKGAWVKAIEDRRLHVVVEGPRSSDEHRKEEP